jgi:preprotein translocase subunit SecG
VATVLFIVQGLLAVVLTVAILLQAKGEGFSGFGGDSSIYHTRRGVEKTLFQFTIALSVAFFLVAIVTSVYVSRQ